jgi:hypothetical protein
MKTIKAQQKLEAAKTRMANAPMKDLPLEQLSAPRLTP